MFELMFLPRQQQLFHQSLIQWNAVLNDDVYQVTPLPFHRKDNAFSSPKCLIQSETLCGCSFIQDSICIHEKWVSDISAPLLKSECYLWWWIWVKLIELWMVVSQQRCSVWSTMPTVDIQPLILIKTFFLTTICQIVYGRNLE